MAPEKCAKSKLLDFGFFTSTTFLFVAVESFHHAIAIAYLKHTNPVARLVGVR
jgi:hypothetical protein